MYLFISGAEIFVILVIVVMLFGADKIPELARGLGKGMQQLKNATNEVKKEITETAKKQGIDTDLTKDINNEVKKIKNTVQDNIDDITGPIKRNL
jgi:sec-independent protein translocase protein TatA